MDEKKKARYPFELEQYIPFRFNLILERSSQLIEHGLRRHELTRPEFRVLMWAHMYPEVSGTVVARSLMMDKSRVVRAIDRLVQRGMIARRTNPQDKRENLLTLTPEGERTYTEASQTAGYIQRRLNTALNEEESRTLSKILIKLDGAMNQLEAEAKSEGLPGL